VVKHPALLAALTDVLHVADTARPFRYADIYGGWANYTLPAKGEWRLGIGQTNAIQKLSQAKSQWVREWAQRYAANAADGSLYPGSVTIAVDAACSQGHELRISVWDTSAAPVANLRGTLGRRHQVYSRAARPNDHDVVEADFLFIDPWGLGEWSAIKKFVGLPAGNILIWLPVSADKDGYESEKSRDVRADAKSLDLDVTVVRWDRNRIPCNRVMLGCQLAHRFARKGTTRALDVAARDIADAFCWRKET
jgi:hypothetical protein